MNDYLSSLVARAQSAAPMIAPRRASRFENPAEPLPEAFGGGARGVFAEPLQMEISPRAERPAESRPGGEFRPDRPSSASEVFEREPARSEPAPLPEPFFPNEQRKSPTPAPTLVTHLHTHPAVLGERRENRETPPLPRPESTALPRGPMTPAAPAADHETAREPAPPMSPPRPESAARASVPPTVERVVMSEYRVPPATNADRERRAEGEPRAPRIEVTIGTVEVRALVSPPAAPPAAPRPSREAARVPSLDDYLNGRRARRA